jgi:hypothetical protein
LLNIIDNTKLYTFNRENGIKGDNIGAHCIDTAMFMVPWQMCRNVKWIIDKYEADGHYIKDCKTLANENVHIYVDNAMCYYNKVV